MQMRVRSLAKQGKQYLMRQIKKTQRSKNSNFVEEQQSLLHRPQPQRHDIVRSARMEEVRQGKTKI